ncbi:MAG: helix-turn-helix domain-containing protein [Gallionellaceae bacterium]
MNLNDLQNVWQEFNRATHISAIRDEKHYAEMVSLADSMTEVIGSAKKHPLLDLFDLVSELIRAYDAEHYAVPDASPREMLRFLMEQHGLSQSDLPEVGNQSVISMLLSGTRQLNVRQIQALSARFHVSPNVFIEKMETLH